MFVVEIVKAGKELQKSYEGRYIYQQVFRSGSSAGANYEESHSAQSRKDFIHKRELCLKELRESLYWLKLIERAYLAPSINDQLLILMKECRELLNIIAKSVVSTKLSMNKKQ